MGLWENYDSPGTIFFSLLFFLALLATSGAILLMVKLRSENEQLKKENQKLNQVLDEASRMQVEPRQKKRRPTTPCSDLTASERASRRKQRSKSSRSSQLSEKKPVVTFTVDENAIQKRSAGASHLFTGTTPLNSSEVAPNPGSSTKRSVAERVACPFTPAEFAEAMRQTVSFINHYTEHPDEYPVTTKLKPWSLVAALPKTPPQYPEEYADVLIDLKKLVLPMFTHWQHPRFMAYFPHGRNHADILSMALEAAFSVVGFSYDSCPAITELEVVTVNWLADCFGLPKGFRWNTDDIQGSPGGGFFLPSASDGVFASVMAARDWKFERILKKFHEGKLDKRVNLDHYRSNKHDLRHEICQRMVVYASKDAHSCLELACKMAMVRCHPIQATADNDWGITGAQLEEAIAQDLAVGLVPFHVHVTLGTTSTASCDHLKSIWPVARKYKLWLHVDAAYAGGAWVDPKYRMHTEGLAHATTININCNKFFMHVSPGAILWTQDKDTFKKGFSLTPPYLKASKDDTVDLRDFGVQLTRTFRSLRTWILMRTTGVEGLRYYINKMIDLSAYCEHLIKQHPNVRPFCKRNYGLFCFYYYEPNMSFDECNAATRTLSGYINDTHELFITRSNVGGQEIIRLTVNYINSTAQTVEKNMELLKKIIDDFRDDWALSKHSVSSAPNPLEGRNARPGPALYDIDLKGTPLPDVDPALVEHWAETPNPITRQESIRETYRLPRSTSISVSSEALVTATDTTQVEPSGTSISTASLAPPSSNLQTATGTTQFGLSIVSGREQTKLRMATGIAQFEQSSVPVSTAHQQTSLQTAIPNGAPSTQLPMKTLNQPSSSVPEATMKQG
ncbi:unnamed protein product, partial [Mesorhabditis belari]|uniref:Uncharacterized protein n=1 Tax=Mesorhabditis belari TaxID=2138241 RepID=A0AAF3J7E2_9BILA